MLIEGYHLDVTSPECRPGSERFVAVARLGKDVGRVLPYLNARLPGAIYDHRAGILTWKQGDHTVAIRPTTIHIGNLADREEATRVADEVIAMVNGTWERRDEIEPSLAQRSRPTPMPVYKLLPGTNCGACGAATCFQFALQLVSGQAGLEQCPPLVDGSGAGRRAELEALLGGPNSG